jgi:phosphoserine aminotransferase
MELSHRSAAFDGVISSARQRFRRLLSIPDDYEVLFLQGGASLQFHMIPLNLVGPEDSIDMILTGTWTNKALKEAQRNCQAHAIWDGKADQYRRLPSSEELTASPDSTYLHYTSNNTIYGTAFADAPQPGGQRLVADMSSDICSREIDVSQHAVIFAGAQKNLGPSGVTAVVLSPWAVERSRTVGNQRQGGLPSMLDFGLMVDKGSMFNTPNTFGIFALDRVLAWLEGLGGIGAIHERNTRKASKLYGVLDGSDFWQPHAERSARSMMNVTWRCIHHELEPVFVAEAAREGLMGLKGHRSVGGLRASIYNACPEESVRVLTDFMVEFERSHG